jgi:hypothetical protein
VGGPGGAPLAVALPLWQDALRSSHISSDIIYQRLEYSQHATLVSLNHDQQQRLAAIYTREVFAHLLDLLYDPTLDGLPPSVSQS